LPKPFENNHLLKDRDKLRLAVLSPFLDRQHGTELCIIEQIERLSQLDHWEIHLYSQKVQQLDGVRRAGNPSSDNNKEGIVWHKIADIPGPHLFKYLWWFFANQIWRWWDKRSGLICPQLTYSPGINCLDADVIVVHIVFHEFYARVRSELALNRTALSHWPRVIHRKLYYKLIKALERKIYSQRSVALVAVSTLVAKQLKTHFQRDDVNVIPNAVDTIRFSPEARRVRRSESRKLFQYSDEEIVILLIGNDWKKKGVDTLISAARQVGNPHLRLLLVGGDDPSFYREMIDKLNLREQIRFEEPRREVLDFYAAADLYAGPSLEDAFNLPILEAMACGLPVIGSVEAGASENISDGETGLLLRNPKDHEELAEHIRRIVEDENLGARLGIAASQFVRVNCTWDQNAEKTRQVLEEKLSGRRRA
jgi:glycosyltransferase involved in cell wall biosynthesis